MKGPENSEVVGAFRGPAIKWFRSPPRAAEGTSFYPTIFRTNGEALGTGGKMVRLAANIGEENSFFEDIEKSIHRRVSHVNRRAANLADGKGVRSFDMGGKNFISC